MSDDAPNVALEALTDTDQPGGATAGRSHADRIAQRRAERRRGGGREKSFVVPPGELRVWYSPLKLKTIQAAVKGKGPMLANVELLVRACKRIEIIDVDTGDWIDAAGETDEPGQPVRFDHRLADLLKLRGDTPANILIDAFEANDRAILSHARRLDEWSSGEDLDDAADVELDELLGEDDAETLP